MDVLAAGAAAVVVAAPILPYALSFAAGAMVYVVVEELIPEAQQAFAQAPVKIGLGETLVRG